LTGIANRRHFEERAISEISRLDRHGTPLTVAAFDIDHFKRVNDTYGHAAGDRVLVEIAAMARRCLRPNDLIARIGGEEFALLLPATDKSGALVIAERVRAELEALNISFRDIEVRVTASFGVAEHVRGARQLDDALLRADVALYRAKRNGRNRIECDG
jgi:diguanylate cyclase (GGDEF)-like protein